MKGRGSRVLCSLLLKRGGGFEEGGEEQEFVEA